MIIRVFDKRNGLLISLLSLMQLLAAKVPGFSSITWRVTRARSGHGINVCDLEDKLDENDSMDISMDDLIAWLETGEYFSSVRIVSASNDLSFGIEDSTYLYVDSGDRELIDAVTIAYERTQVV